MRQAAGALEGTPWRMEGGCEQCPPSLHAGVRFLWDGRERQDKPLLVFDLESVGIVHVWVRASELLIKHQLVSGHSLDGRGSGAQEVVLD